MATKEELQQRLMQVEKNQLSIANNAAELRKELEKKELPTVCVGQIYRLPNQYNCIRMVTSACGIKYVLTVVGGYCSGCYSGSLQTEPLSEEKMFELLERENAEYLGTFDDFFVEKRIK